MYILVTNMYGVYILVTNSVCEGLVIEESVIHCDAVFTFSPCYHQDSFLRFFVPPAVLESTVGRMWLGLLEARLSCYLIVISQSCVPALKQHLC